jgi:hypothetical protein
MAIRMYALAMVILLYITGILFPITLNINDNLSIVLFIVISMVFFRVAKDKWWVKILSVVIGVVVFMLIMTFL